jgi:hypothetical protein
VEVKTLPIGEIGRANAICKTNTHRQSYTPGRQMQRRQHAAARLPPLACGCVDPWTCRCDGDPPLDDLPSCSDTRQTPPRRPLSLTASLEALRHAWTRSEHDYRQQIADIADVLTELAEAQ